MTVSYQIIYNTNEIKPQKTHKKRKHKSLFIVIIVILFLGVLRYSSWDNTLWEQLIPGNTEVTKSAFQTFTESLENGASFSDAVFVFCDTVIQGAALA